MMSARIQKLLLVSLVSMAVVATAFCFPFAFSAIDKQWAADFWLFISDSGGVVGVSLITLAFCVLISWHYIGWRRKLWIIVLSLVAFSAVLGLFARLNEYFIKESLRVERPNIIYLHETSDFDKDAFYVFETKDERRRYLRYFLQTKPEGISINGELLHPKVLEHWVHETGFSFPSGHSFNSFLMATLMAYIILFVYADFKRRRFFILPFVWATLVALSRVLLGVHSPVDIVFGASFGVLIGFVIISTKYIDKLLIKKVG